MEFVQLDEAQLDGGTHVQVDEAQLDGGMHVQVAGTAAVLDQVCALNPKPATRHAPLIELLFVQSPSTRAWYPSLDRNPVSLSSPHKALGARALRAFRIVSEVLFVAVNLSCAS